MKILLQLVGNLVVECGSITLLVGPIALVWNSDEPMPLNGDIRLSTDIFIFDTTGKKVWILVMTYF